MSEFDLTLDRERLAEVRHGAVLVTTEPAVFRIQGPGALTCLQGLLTNDLVKPGDNSLVYGALLDGHVVIKYLRSHPPAARTQTFLIYDFRQHAAVAVGGEDVAVRADDDLHRAVLARTSAVATAFDGACAEEHETHARLTSSSEKPMHLALAC